MMFLFTDKANITELESSTFCLYHLAHIFVFTKKKKKITVTYEISVSNVHNNALHMN